MIRLHPRLRHDKSGGALSKFRIIYKNHRQNRQNSLRVQSNRFMFLTNHKSRSRHAVPEYRTHKKRAAANFCNSSLKGIWRRGSESNRSKRFCRPLPNLLATTPCLKYKITCYNGFVNPMRVKKDKILLLSHLL